MSTPRLIIPAACAVAALAWLAVWQRPAPMMFGFTRTGARLEAALERRFLGASHAAGIADEHKVLSAEPHIAGSARDHSLMVRMRDRFEEYGLEQVEVTTHDVLLPWPEEVSVEMTTPVPWRATMREEPVLEDPDTQIDAAAAGIPYHAYSASGEVTASAVDVGHGEPADYAALDSRGVNVRGRIVLARSSVPYRYRGFKVLTAQQRGAVGILIYSDPPDDQRSGGGAYSHGSPRPETQIQRGAVAYDFIVPGDPLTPGWASVAGARRIATEDAVSLPRIISAPISYRDARAILGARDPTVRIRVRLDDRIRPVWTVTGMIRGAEHPDELVIVGNHRDAWIYGGVDPSGGSAALMELARSLGALARSGWRPNRSIVFASWDAEEFALTSSTEWGEQHADDLSRHAVAYINVDSAASGSRFTATAVPALNRAIAEAAQAVRDPGSGTSVAAAARDRRARDLATLSTGDARELVGNRLGSGSDYAVFLNHLGIPVADLTFAGPSGVYHTLYDTHRWVARTADPGFRYHAALMQIWGVLTLRLANADAVPLDYEEYADHIVAFIREVEHRSRQPGAVARAFGELTSAGARFQASANAFGRSRDAALARGDRVALPSMNEKVLTVERALLDPAGIPGRPWYRHLVYAPKYSYEPEVLPGLSEAIDTGDPAQIAAAAHRLAAALDRASRALE
jgi:N-acetylated-alpha-linked acidic dipeptidase